MNSKQRKLKYIRQKNSLRNGGVLTWYYKTYKHYQSKDDIKSNNDNDVLDLIVKQQEQRFKIKLKVKDTICNYQNDDFTTDIVTTKIFLTRK